MLLIWNKIIIFEAKQVINVLEPVIPLRSGPVMVKLAKRGNNLGIVCKSETNNEKGEPVIISDIRTGRLFFKFYTNLNYS